jgi:hypothetical protein
MCLGAGHRLPLLLLLLPPPPLPPPPLLFAVRSAIIDCSMSY